MTKIEIINETVAYYSEDVTRRGAKLVEDNDMEPCEYLTDSGKMCAVGRCMINPGKGYHGTVWSMTYDEMGEIYVIDLDIELKDQYRGHNKVFWRDLQVLHDRRHFWCNEGLTKGGREYLNSLIKKYENE